MDTKPIDPRLDVALSVLKGKTDISRVFLLYMNSGGDRFKTAVASNLSVEEVDILARVEGWDTKLDLRRKSIEGSETASPEDLNREIVRMRVAAQAERVMAEIDEVLLHLEKMDPEEKLQYLFETDRTGKKTPTAKFYLELSKAIETVSQAAYRGHQDQLPMRPNAVDSDAVGKRIAENAGLGLMRFLAEQPTKSKPINIDIK